MKNDFPANPLEKPGYVLEWQDEFDAGKLDISKWLPYHLPHWSSTEQSKANYTFRDGCLILQITDDQQPWNPEFDGNLRASTLQTGLFAGMLGSKQGQLRFHPELTVRESQTNVRLYTPLYGYFECRAKCHGSPDTHVSLWMIGYEDVPEHCGAIDMFEVFGKDVRSKSAIIGYGVHAWEDEALTKAFYRDEVTVDATAFHVYALEWTPNHIDFYIDNQHLRRIQQSPNYPQQLMLSIFERSSRDGNTVYPKEFVVDYVRGYQPRNGY